MISQPGGYHSLALKSDGTVVAWGANHSGQTNVPSGLTGVVAISAGDFHNLAIVSAVAEVPSNTAPTAYPGGPYLGAVNTAISFDGSLSSDPENDELTYAWDFGDGALDTGAAPTHFPQLPINIEPKSMIISTLWGHLYVFKNSR